MKGRININRKLLSIVLCIVLISVFSLTIAYAALSVTLNITGTAEISDASWNIRFDNIKVNPASVAITPKITNNTTLTFSADLTEPGDFYKFTVDIVNDGTIDAMIDSIIKTPELTTEQKKYLKFEVEYSDGQSISTKQILKAKETKNISVLFSFRTDIPTSDLPTTSSNFNVSLKLVYYQSDTTGVNITTGANKVNIVSGDMDTVGSEVCIKNECFYVMYSVETTVTMLAKYNLYVGNECIYSDSSSCVPYGDKATRIQDSTMIGYGIDNLNGKESMKGTTVFSSTNYWKDTVSKYPAYVYNENSYLYEYIENYKNYLDNLGRTPSKARLITMEELEELGCSRGNHRCTSAPEWVSSTSYWSGTASDINVWYVSSTSYYNDDRGYIGDNYFGVRPVIVISKEYF